MSSRRQQKKKAKPKKQNKDKKSNNKSSSSAPSASDSVKYGADSIPKEVRDIRMMIAKDDNEAAMARINDIDQHLSKRGETLPLMLNSLKCLILAHCHEHDALRLVLHEIHTLLADNYANAWDVDSLNCLVNACKRSGHIEHLMHFLECALHTTVSKTEERSRELYFAYFVNGEYHKQSQIAQQMKRVFTDSGDEYTMWGIVGTLTKVVIANFRYLPLNHCVALCQSTRDGNNANVSAVMTRLSDTDDKILRIQQMMFERTFLSSSAKRKQSNFDALVAVYHYILTLRQQWQTMQEWLEGDIMRECFVDKQHKLVLWKLECLLRLHDYRGVDALCASLLLLQTGDDDNENVATTNNHRFVDDWQVWYNWVDAQLVLYQQQQPEQGPQEQSGDIQLSDAFKQKCLHLIRGVQRSERIANIEKFRAPYLAEIEFQVKCMQFESGSSIDEARLVPLITQYFVRFASRNASCFADLRKYVERITHSEHQQTLLLAIADAVQEEAVLLCNDDGKDEQQQQSSSLCRALRQKTCAYQIELFVGRWTHESKEALLQRVRTLYETWIACIDRVEKQEHTDETEADDLLLIAAHILLFLAHQTENRSKCRALIMDAIFVCESALVKSRYNFRLRLYLLRLYCHPCLGAMRGAYRQFEELQIRGVQHDSMAHIVFHDASRYGFVTPHTHDMVRTLHEELQDHRREFNQANLHRTPQTLEHGNYHKVIEFAQFDYAMKHSQMFVVAQVDHLFAKVFQFYQHQKTFPNLVDYMETLILPNHPFLKRTAVVDKQPADDAKEAESEYAWHEQEWIDLNDYSSIPSFIGDDKQTYFDRLLRRSPLSTLSNAAASNKADTGDSDSNTSTMCAHVQLLLSYIGVLHTSLTLNGEPQRHSRMEQQLRRAWTALTRLRFVETPYSDDIESVLQACESRNFHWTLWFCFHSLNKRICVAAATARDKDDNTAADAVNTCLHAMCDKFEFFVDETRTSMADSVFLDGSHLQRLWRLIAVVCFPAVTLFEHWTQSSLAKHDDALSKCVAEQGQRVTRKMDQLKRTLSDILHRIESEYKVIDVDQVQKHPNKAKNQSDRDKQRIEKLLKPYEVQHLTHHESILNLNGYVEKKNSENTKVVKLALIRMNNALVQSNVDILKQNISLLKQIRLH